MKVIKKPVVKKVGESIIPMHKDPCCPARSGVEQG